MYLDKRGADKEAVDIYGNTPLGVAMLSQHHNYCIIMIQKNADSTKLVHKVDPEKIKKQWEEEEKSKAMNSNQAQIIEDENMSDEEE
jgi:ankyrin repeat protein